MKATIKVVAAAVVFLFATRFGGIFGFPPSGISTFWPANAILFVILLLSPRSRWLALFVASIIGCFIAQVWIGFPLLNCAVHTLVNCLQAIGAAYLVQRFSAPPYNLTSLQQVTVFVLAAAAVSLLAGSIGATITVLTARDTVWVDVWQKWSMADLTGFFLVAPLLLALADKAHHEVTQHTLARRIEAVILFILLVVSSIAVFGRDAESVRFASGLHYLPFPLLLWGTLRFGRLGTAGASFVVCFLAIVFAIHGRGPFSILTPEENVQSLQIFTTIIVVSLLLLTALLQERSKYLAEVEEKQTALLDAQNVLEQKVADRTREVQNALAQLETQNQRLRDTREQLETQNQRLLDTQEQLVQSQKMEALGVLAGGIAHDFNNILHGISMSAELVKAEIPDNSQAGEDLDMVLKLSKRGAELIKEILTFSRQGESDQHPIQVAPVIADALKLLRATLPSTIEMRQDIPSRGLRILGNRARVHQVVINLCTNAAYAMRVTGGVLDVNVDTVDLSPSDSGVRPLKPGRYVRLRVKDDGPGISDDIKPRIFEPFFTTKPVGEGSGMGLAVVHGIVQKHEGAITVDSKLGQGTTFTVLLPSLDEGMDKIDAPDQRVADGKGRIFLVDDEADLVKMARQLLEKRGYQVIAFTDSRQALERFRSDPYQCDLVLTDQTMPALTGLQLSTEIHKIRADLPIVLVTGYSEHTSPDSLQEAGVQSFIMKPFSGNELAQIIQSKLGDSEPS